MRITTDLVKLGIVIAAMIFLVALGIALGACNPFPGQPVTPDEPSCPCPDFVSARGGDPEDPGHPDGRHCQVMTRTGRNGPWVYAHGMRECVAEARERAGEGR